MEWKKRLLQVRHEWYQSKYQAAKDFGTPLPKPYSDNTTNGLTRCVIDWLKFNRHYCNRMNSQGQCRLEKVELANGGYYKKASWTKGHSNLGTADLHCLINNQFIAIEIKCKATKDRMRPEQLKERDRIERAGGIYYVATDMSSFLEWYNEFINTSTVKHVANL